MVRKLIERALGYTIPLRNITDTLVLSKLLDPERKSPEGWKGKPKPHSVEAWAMRMDLHKPDHDDWTQFSPEQLYRCEQDVLIQFKLLEVLELDAASF